MADFPDVSSVATKLRNTLIQYYNTEEGEWRMVKTTSSTQDTTVSNISLSIQEKSFPEAKNTMIWRKPSEEFSGYLYKAQGIVEDVVNRIVDHIRPGPYRLFWDSLMTSMEVVEEFAENCCVMRYTTAGQLWNIIAPREFVDFSYTTDHEDGLLSCGISLDYGEARASFVRGFNHPCGWFCTPLKDNPGHSLLTGFIQTDVRGMLPQTAVDTAMASTLTTFYSDLRKALKA